MRGDGEFFGEEPFSSLSSVKSSLLNLSQMCRFPAAVFHSQLSSAQADRHSAERLNQPLRLYDFLQKQVSPQNSEGGLDEPKMPFEEIAFFFIPPEASLELFTLTPEVLILPLSQ